MAMVIGSIIVIAGVVIGWWTVAGSGIHEHPYGGSDAPGASRASGESPLDSPWQMDEWSRGTQSRAGRRRRRRNAAAPRDARQPGRPPDD
jgi:hypothetical protein